MAEFIMGFVTGLIVGVALMLWLVFAEFRSEECGDG